MSESFKLDNSSFKMDNMANCQIMANREENKVHN